MANMPPMEDSFSNRVSPARPWVSPRACDFLSVALTTTDVLQCMVPTRLEGASSNNSSVFGSGGSGSSLMVIFCSRSPLAILVQSLVTLSYLSGGSISLIRIKQTNLCRKTWGDFGHYYFCSGALDENNSVS
jgi:hypothetical protein